MEIIKKYQSFIAIGLAIIGLAALVVLSSNSKSNQTDNKTAATDTSKSTTDDKVTAMKQDTKLASVYNYTAQPGDSYTVLARKAIQTYGINEKVNLSPAQIVAAETQLTVNAGSIELNEGQTLAIDKATVKTAVEFAQKLTAASVAAWQVYVPYVDFNTNAAGKKA